MSKNNINSFLNDFYSWSDTKIAFAIYFISQIFFLIFLFRDIPPGDATGGLYQILNFDLYHKATFVAYHTLGIFFTQSLSILGVQNITALSFMSSFFGAVCAAFTYKFAKHFLGDRKSALIATAFTVFSGEYWLFSEIGDSYIVHTVFVIISLVMFIEKRFIFSGITYGIALLIYPQVGLVAPFYPIIAYRYCYGFKNFLKTVLSATIIYIPPIIILFHEYFWGRMGILPSMIHHVKVGNSYPFFFYLLNGSYYFIKSLHIAIPFIILGFYTSFFQNRFFFLLSIVLLPMHIYMYFDNPGDPHSYALTIYPFLGILGALGLMKILNAVMSCKKHLKILLTIFLIYVLLSFFFKIIQINKTTHDYRNFAESFHYNQNGDYRIISDWAICINYNFYTTSTLYSGKCISYKNLKNKKLKDFSLKGIRLYFLENKGGINPLKIVKTYLIQFIPKTHTIRPIKDSGSFAKGLLRNNPEYKFKLIKANSSFYLYELIPENI